MKASELGVLRIRMLRSKDSKGLQAGGNEKRERGILLAKAHHSSGTTV